VQSLGVTHTLWGGEEPSNSGVVANVMSFIEDQKWRVNRGMTDGAIPYILDCTNQFRFDSLESPMNVWALVQR
jgi:hypothetical protein